MKKITGILIIGFWHLLAFGQLSGVSQWFPYQKENGKWCFVSVRNGAVLNKQEFDSITEFQDAGIAKVKQNGHWGILDTNGRMVLPAIYQTIEYSGLTNWSFRPEVLFLEKENTPIKGICNMQGAFINPFKYSRVEPLNSQGNDWYTTPFTPLGAFYGLYACYPSRTSEVYEVVNNDGVVILDSNRIKEASRNELHYYLNADRIVSEFNFREARLAKREKPDARFLAMSTAGKMYYGISSPSGITIIDYDGNVVNKDEPFIDFYSLTPAFIVNENLDSVLYFIGRKGDAFGMIDETGKHIIAFEYEVLNTQSNRVFGYKNQQSYCFDTQFQATAGGCRFFGEGLGSMIDGYFKVTRDQKKGVDNLQGKVIVPPVWDKVDATHFRKGTNFIGMSKPEYDKKLKMHLSKQIAVYDPSGKLITRKTNAQVRLLGQNLVFLEYKSKIEIIGPDGKTIIESKKPEPHPHLSEDQYVRHDYQVIDAYKDRFVYHTLFRSVDGWIVLDTNGVIVFRSQLKGYDYAVAMVNSESRVVGVIGITENQASALETESGLLPFSLVNYGYDVRDNRIYGGNLSRDSVAVISLSGQILKTVKDFSKIDYVTINYTTHREEINLDSSYTIYDGEVYRFTDYNFRPYEHPAITNYQVVQKNIIGRNKDQYFLMFRKGEWVANPRRYEKILPFTLQSFTCFNGNMADIYTPEGELLFENCTNLKQYKGYRSFNLGEKTIWMTNEGKVYEPK